MLATHWLRIPAPHRGCERHGKAGFVSSPAVLNMRTVRDSRQRSDTHQMDEGTSVLAGGGGCGASVLESSRGQAALAASAKARPTGARPSDGRVGVCLPSPPTVRPSEGRA